MNRPESQSVRGLESYLLLGIEGYRQTILRLQEVGEGDESGPSPEGTPSGEAPDTFTENGFRLP